MLAALLRRFDLCPWPPRGICSALFPRQSDVEGTQKAKSWLGLDRVGPSIQTAERDLGVLRLHAAETSIAGTF
jgi:hypothetical protein